MYLGTYKYLNPPYKSAVSRLRHVDFGGDATNDLMVQHRRGTFDDDTTECPPFIDKTDHRFDSQSSKAASGTP
jgi:hypothetical protein